MKQQTFSDIEYSNRKLKTKREEFLEIMDEIIPWDEWVSVIIPFYPSGKRGRPPKGIEKMLGMYLLKVWFNLSDEGTEDAIYDSYAMRKFVGINFLEEDAPDATTLLKFRRLLAYLSENGEDSEEYVVNVAMPLLSALFSSPWAFKAALHDLKITDRTLLDSASDWIRQAENEHE